MGEAGSRCGKSPLHTSAGSTKLRRRHTFAGPTRRTRHFFLRRSGNLLPREKISSCGIYLEIPARRTRARIARLLRKALRGGFSRFTARSGQTHLVVPKWVSSVQSYSCPKG